MGLTNAHDGIDPFHLYLQLVEQFGEGHAFLLDAAEDKGSPEYRMSLVASLPLLEVQVKNHFISLHVKGGLRTYLGAFLADTGYLPVDDRLAPASLSVIAGDALHYQERDPMAFLEALRRGVRALRQQSTEVPFSAGFLGYIGYDAAHYLETLPSTTVDDRELPDIRLQWFGVITQLASGSPRLFDVREMVAAVFSPDDLAVYDAQVLRVRDILDTCAERAGAALTLPATPAQDSVTLVDDVSQAEFEDGVRRAQAYIRAGDIFQVVLSKRMRVSKRQHPYVAYDRLRRLNPSPYMFMVEYPGMRLFGASPEVQFRVVHGVAEMKPIAGTSKGRGQSPQEDERLRQALVSDEKEQAEHVMLVDLCRNDVGRISKTGTVHVPQFMEVEPYAHLYHLVSQVKGALRPDVSVFHALVTTFPAGTLSGAPKIRAMEVIDELERYHRGPYGGLIGMIDFDGNANTAIIIRTVIDCQDTYFVQVGAGIVADSDPTQEWLECGHKSRAVLSVLGVLDEVAIVR